MSVGKETWGRLSPLLDELLDLPERPVEPSIRQLKAELAAVEPVLEGIRRAQDTVFIDAAAHAAWQELSSRVDALEHELQSQLMAIG